MFGVSGSGKLEVFIFVKCSLFGSRDISRPKKAPKKVAPCNYDDIHMVRVPGLHFL